MSDKDKRDFWAAMFVAAFAKAEHELAYQNLNYAADVADSALVLFEDRFSGEEGGQ